MAESSFDGKKVRHEAHSLEKDNYDRLLSIFHTGTDVKRYLLDIYLRDKKIDLLDWLTTISKRFLQFEDIKKARRRSSTMTPTDLGLNTIDTVLKYNCFDMFWECCLMNTCLEDILNKHKEELYRIYLNSIGQHDSTSLPLNLTDVQWNLLFEMKDYTGLISACKGITVSSLDSNLNVLILDLICPLFKAVHAISDCQIRISKIAIDKHKQALDFDDIWNIMEKNILFVGEHCILDENLRKSVARIKCTRFNRTLALDNRKCILEEAFNNPAFIDDKIFCDRVQTELDDIAFEENINLLKTLCEREICVNLAKGHYRKGAYTQCVLENAEKDLNVRKSVCSSQVHSRQKGELDLENQIGQDDILERCNKHNYLKVVQLIVDIGKDALLVALKFRLPAGDYGQAFNGMKQRILPLLNLSERQLLYPDGSRYSGDLTDLDISLLYIILRNVNTITPHKQKWGNNPEDKDESLSANIERIRIFKNKYVSHCTKCAMNETEFPNTWKEISKCIIQIGGTEYAQRIDCLLTLEINPVIEKELNAALETLKERESEKDRQIIRLEEKIDSFKRKSTMLNGRSLNNANETDLGYVPLKLTLSGEGIPSVNEIKPDDCSNGDIRINRIDEGSIIISLDVWPPALQNIGYFLNVIDTLILGLLEKSATSVIDRAKVVPVIISMEFMGLFSESQTNLHEQRTKQCVAQERQDQKEKHWLAKKITQKYHPVSSTELKKARDSVKFMTLLDNYKRLQLTQEKEYKEVDRRGEEFKKKNLKDSPDSVLLRRYAEQCQDQKTSCKIL